MSFSNYLELKLLDHVFGGVTTPYTPPATLYVGLSSTTPAEDGTGITEPSGGGYARVAVTNNATNWPAATVPGTKSNGTVITFAPASATWLAGVNLTRGLVFDAVTGGNLLGERALALAQPVLSGNQVTFPIGTFVITLD